jgi:hypothetical protein
VSKRTELHEDFAREEQIQGPSDRKFGLTFAVVFLALGVLSAWHRSVWSYTWLAIAIAFGLTALLWAHVLAPLNRAWMALGLLLYRIVNPLVMAILFYGTVFPTALVMRLMGKDPLNRRFDPHAQSYWVERHPPGPSPESLKNQF